MDANEVIAAAATACNLDPNRTVTAGIVVLEVYNVETDEWGVVIRHTTGIPVWRLIPLVEMGGNYLDEVLRSYDGEPQ